MDITIGITVDDTAYSNMTAMTADKGAVEELLVHKLVADNDFVISAVIMRARDCFGVAYFPDESTRQSR